MSLNSGVKSMLMPQFKVHGAFQSQRINETAIDSTHFTLQDAPILGVGGFGIVRLACKISMYSRNPNVLDLYAVKSVAKKNVLARTSGPIAIFTELKCLKILADSEVGLSPFIANVSYAFHDSRYLYLTLEYCSGGDIRHNLRLQKYHRFNESTAKFLISQVLLAIQHCHDNNILHRDVKPENLILDSSGYIKLTDFGVSKLFHDSHMICKSTSGTHGYMAPEVYLKGHVHSKPADYFAIGVTLHELVLGQRPFDAQTIKHTAACYAKRLSSSEKTFPNTNNHLMHDPYEGLPNCGLTLDILHEAPFLSHQCKTFISNLLCFYPNQRLGSCVVTSQFGELIGIDTIKKHSWFHDYNWKSLSKRLVSSPIRPEPNTSHFPHINSREFNQNFIRDHCNTLPVNIEEDKVFEGYEYKTALNEE